MKTHCSNYCLVSWNNYLTYTYSLVNSFSSFKSSYWGASSVPGTSLDSLILTNSLNSFNKPFGLLLIFSFYRWRKGSPERSLRVLHKSHSLFCSKENRVRNLSQGNEALPLVMPMLVDLLKYWGTGVPSGPCFSKQSSHRGDICLWNILQYSSSLDPLQELLKIQQNKYQIFLLPTTSWKCNLLLLELQAFSSLHKSGAPIDSICI